MKKNLRITICMVALVVAVALLAVACGDKVTLSSIEIDEDTLKTVFNEGEAVNLEGAQIILTYSDGKTEAIELTQSMLSGEINTSVVGPHTLRVTYNDRSCLLTYTVMASAAPAGTAVVTLQGVRTDYKLNDKLSYEGNLVATFADGEQRTWALADIKADLTVNGFKTDKEGTYTCQLSYDPQIYGVLTAEYTYTVAPLSSIATAAYTYDAQLKVFQYQTKDEFLNILNVHPFLFTYEDGTSAEVSVQNAGQIDRAYDSQTVGQNYVVSVTVTDSHLRSAKINVRYEVIQRFAVYKVTFYPVCEDMSPITVDSSEETGKVEQQIFNRPGYQCRGWHVDSVDGVKFDFNTVLTANLDLYADWQLQHYTIRITNFGTTYTYPRTYTINDNAFTLDNPTAPYDGYEFVSYEATTGVYENNVVNPARYTGDLELVANWRPIAYRLHYELQDDESYPVANRDLYADTTYTTQDNTPLPTPVREGYTFMGWSTDVDGSTILSTMRMQTENKVLYAIWTPNVYTITYIHDATGNVLGTKSFSINTQNTPIPAANIPGYRFEGWYTDEACTVEFYKRNGNYVLMRGAYTDNFNLYAKTARVYTLYLAREDETVPITFAIGEEDTPAYLAAWRQASVGVNCDLRYWQYDGDDMPALEVYVVDNDGNDHVSITTATLATYDGKTFHPVWKGRLHNITYHLGYDDVIETDTYDTYEGKTLLVPTRNGYSYDGWKTADSNLSVYAIEGRSTDADLVFYAKWRVNEYTLNLHYNIAADLLQTTIRGTAAKTLEKLSDTEYRCKYKITDEAFTFAPLPTAKFHQFGGWYTTRDGVDGVELTALDGTYGITDLWAQWTPTTYAIAFAAADGKDFVLGEGQTATVDYTTATLTLQVPTRDYYTFGGWYTDSGLTQAVAQTDGQYVLDVLALFGASDLSAAEGQTLATVYAKWTADEYTLSFGAGKMGNTTVTTATNANLVGDATSVQFSANNVLTLQAATATCYDFSGWYKSLSYNDDDLVTTTENLQAVAGANRQVTLYPKWQLHQYAISYDGLNGLVAELDLPTTYTLGDSRFGTTNNFTANLINKLKNRFGYTLTGNKVYGNPEKTTAVTTLGTSAAACQDVTLYTNWSLVTYTLNLKAMPRTGNTATNYTASEWGDYRLTALNVDNASNYTLPEMRLVGQVTQSLWYTSTALSDIGIASGKMTIAKMKEIFGTKTSQTLYAKFEIETYVLDYDCNMDVALPEATTYNYFDGIALPEAPEVPAGYRWEGWYLDQNYAGEPITAIGTKQASGNRTVMGRVELIHTITYTLEGATCDAVTNETAVTEFTVAAATTLPTPTYEGYTFSGWYTASLGNVGVLLPKDVSQNVTLVPLFYNSGTAGLKVAYRQDGKGVVSAYTGTGATSLALPTQMGTPNALASAPVDVVEVGANLLYQNTKVTSVTVPEGYLYVGATAFAQSKIAGITLPSTILSIGSNAFNNSAVKTATLNGGAIGEGSYVFANCANLATVSMTNCTVAAGAHMFYNCANLATVTLVGTGYGVGTLADATALVTLKVNCGVRLITLFGQAADAPNVASTFTKFSTLYLLKDCVPTATFASGIAYASTVTKVYIEHTTVLDVTNGEGGLNIAELHSYLNADGRTIYVPKSPSSLQSSYMSTYGWSNTKVVKY